jgi:exonuclease III
VVITQYVIPKGERAERGIAIVVHKSIVRRVVKKIVCNDWIIALKIKAEPVSILLVQVCMPTSEYEDDEVEELYDILKKFLKRMESQTNNIIMGDLNSMIGGESYRNIVEPYGLGRRNQRGQMLIDFCERNGLVIISTWFKKPKRRLYTWKSSGDQSRQQLDYILVKHRFRNCIKDVPTMPGADTASDHNLLFAKICTRLKIKFYRGKPRWYLKKLHAQ